MFSFETWKKDSMAKDLPDLSAVNGYYEELDGSHFNLLRSDERVFLTWWTWYQSYRTSLGKIHRLIFCHKFDVRENYLRNSLVRFNEYNIDCLGSSTLVHLYSCQIKKKFPKTTILPMIFWRMASNWSRHIIKCYFPCLFFINNICF